MSSHLLTVAKATFAASLLRPDVTKVDRDEVPHFHSLLEAAMLKCSPSNIQTCKQWLLKNIAPSSSRMNALLKYATILTRDVPISEEKPVKTPAARRRLHLLYLLHDLLHHAKHHAQDVSLQNNIAQACQSSMVELYRLAASESKPRTLQRLQNLVDIWELEQFFSLDYLRQLRQTLADPAAGVSSSEEPATSTTMSSRDVPFMMPASHGDPTLPFYELPAGNLMPHIHPKKTIAMQPESIRPLQFAAGPADESLVNAVKDFLKDVAAIDDAFQHLDDEGIVPDIDDLGQLSYRNEAGDLVGDTYYGWSRAFCDKMLAKRKAPLNGQGGRQRSGSYSSSRSRSHSRSPHKRRRYSNSTRSRSSSRSRSRHVTRDRSRHEPTRSVSPPVRFMRQSISNDAPHKAQDNWSAPQSFPAPGSFDSRLPQLPLPPLGPNGLPLPPPRPPNWSGPWPPPPPRPPAAPPFDSRRDYSSYGRQ